MAERPQGCSVLYIFSCETWITQDLRAAESIYNMTLKNLLGVRATSCNEIVFAECGEFGAKAFVKNLQASFLRKLVSRDSYQGSYLQKVINLAMQSRCPAGRQIDLLLKELHVDFNQ